MLNSQAMQLLLPLALLAFFWFFLIRPQQVQQKKRQEMLNSLRKGDKVVTIGGIHGQIQEIGPDTMILRIAKELDVTLSRSAIGSVRREEEAETK